MNVCQKPQFLLPSHLSVTEVGQNILSPYNACLIGMIAITEKFMNTKRSEGYIGDEKLNQGRSQIITLHWLLIVQLVMLYIITSPT